MSFASNMLSSYRNNRALRKKIAFDPHKTKDKEIQAKGRIEVEPLSPDLRAQIKEKASSDQMQKQKMSLVILAAVIAGVLWFFLSYIF